MPTELQITSPLSGRKYKVAFEKDATEDDINDAVAHIRDSESDTGQSLASSALLAVPRGATQSFGSLVEGIGDLSGISEVSEAGQGIKDVAARDFAVNPSQEDSLLVKSGGVIGQVGEQIGEMAVGGPVLRAAGMTGKAATTAAFLIPSFIKGADQGEDIARQYDMSGINKALATLGGGLVEAGTEAFGSKFLPGGGMAVETALANKLLTRGAAKVLQGSAGKQLGHAVLTEGLEEIESQIGQNVLTKTLSEEDPKRPGFSKNGQPIPGILGGDLLEQGLLGSIGGLAFGGVNALSSKPRRMVDYQKADGTMGSAPVPEHIDAASLGVKTRLATKDENAAWDALDVGQTLMETKVRTKELEDKTDRTKEDDAVLADLRAVDKRLTSWLGAKAAEKTLTEGKAQIDTSDPLASVQRVEETAKDARSLIEGARVTPEPGEENFQMPAEHSFDLVGTTEESSEGAPAAAEGGFGGSPLAALKPNVGWKFHLATDNPYAVSEILKTLGLKHKVGKNSGQVGKDITVYVGSRNDANAAAKAIEAQAGQLLKNPEGDALQDDIPFTGKVMGRFDAQGDTEFSQYGSQGVSYLETDMADKTFGNTEVTPEQRVENAKKVLASRYGEFFTGKEVIPDETQEGRKAEVLAQPQAGVAEVGDTGTQISKPVESKPEESESKPTFAEALGTGRDLTKWSPNELKIAQEVADGNHSNVRALPPVKRTAVFNTLTELGISTEPNKFSPIAQKGGTVITDPKVGDVVTLDGVNFRVEETGDQISLYNPQYGMQKVDKGTPLPVQAHIRGSASETLTNRTPIVGVEKISKDLAKRVGVDVVEVAQTPQQMAEFLESERTSLDPDKRRMATTGHSAKGAYVQKSNRAGMKGKSVLYLNLSNVTADTPIHEVVGHQFMEWLKVQNPQLWNEGARLLKANGDYLDGVRVLYFDEIEALRAKAGDQAAEDYLMEEAMATVMGHKGQDIWQTTPQSRKTWARLKAWIERVWTSFKRWAANNGLLGPKAYEAWTSNFGIRGATIAEWARSANLAVRTGVFDDRIKATKAGQKEMEDLKSEPRLSKGVKPVVTRLSGGRYEIYVGRKKVGQAFATRHGNRATLDAIDIEEDQQKKGYGTLLLRDIVQDLGEQGVKSLNSSNEGSGTIQMLDKVFGRNNVKHFSGNAEIDFEEARKIMDVDFGYTRSEADISALGIEAPKPIWYSKDPSKQAANRIKLLPEGEERTVMERTMAAVRWTQPDDPAIAQAEKFYKTAGKEGGWGAHIKGLETIWEKAYATPAGLSPSAVAANSDYIYDSTPGLYLGMVLSGLRDAATNPQSSPAQRKAAVRDMAALAKSSALYAARAGRFLRGFHEGYRQFAFPELVVSALNREFTHGSEEEAKEHDQETQDMMAQVYEIFGQQLLDTVDDPKQRADVMAALERSLGASFKADLVADALEQTLDKSTEDGSLGDLIEKTIDSYTGSLKEAASEWIRSVVRLDVIRKLRADSEARQSKVSLSAMQAEIQKEVLAELGTGKVTKEKWDALENKELARQKDLLKALAGHDLAKPARTPKSDRAKQTREERQEQAAYMREVREAYRERAKIDKAGAKMEAEAALTDVDKGAQQVAQLLKRIIRKPGNKDAGDAALRIVSAAIAKQMGATVQQTGRPAVDRALNLAVLMMNPGQAAAIRDEAAKRLELWAKEKGAVYDPAALDAVLQLVTGREFGDGGEEFTPYTAKDVNAALKQNVKDLKDDLRKAIRDNQLTSGKLDKAVAAIRARVEPVYGAAVADKMEAALRAEWTKSLEEHRRDAQMRDEMMEARREQREKARVKAWAFEPTRRAEASEGTPKADKELLGFLMHRFGLKDGKPVKGTPSFALNDLIGQMSEQVRKGGVEKMTQNLAQYLGYDRTQTERFLAPVVAAAMRHMDAARRAKVEKALAPKKPPGDKESYFAKQLRLIQHGALDHDAYAAVLLGAQGKKGMSDALKAELTGLIARRNSLPADSVQQGHVDMQIKQLVSAARGIGIGSYLAETTMAHTFGGISTHKVNAVFGAITAWTDIVSHVAATVNLQKNLNRSERKALKKALTAQALRGFTDTYARAAAPLILKTGEAFVEDPSVHFITSLLETKKMYPDAPFTFFGRDLPKWMKLPQMGLTKATKFHAYVRRLLVAADLANRAPMWETSIATQAVPEAIQLLKTQGRDITPKAISEAIDEVNYGKGGRQAAVKNARQQVADEASLGQLDPKDLRRTNERIRQILREKLNPLDGMDQASRLEQIEEDGKYATLAHEVPGGLGELSSWLVKGANRIPFGRLFVPAIRVPIAALHKSLDWTPWGFLRWKLAKGGTAPSVTAWLDSLTPKSGGNSRTPLKPGRTYDAARTEALRIRAMVGTAATTLLYALLAASWDDDDDKAWFYITAQGPRDSEEKRQWRQRGFTPYSIKIGPWMFNYRETPLATALTPVGALSDAKRYDNGAHWQSVGERVASTAIMTTASFADQASLQSMLQLLGVVSAGASANSGQEGNMLKRSLSRVVTTSLFPNFGREVNDIMFGPQDTKTRSWAAAILANVPFMPAIDNKPALNLLGETIHEQRGGALGELWNTARYRIATTPVDRPKLHFLAKMDVAKLTTDRRKMDGSLVREDYDLMYEWARRSGKALEKELDEKTISDFEARMKDDRVAAMKEFDKFVSGIRKSALDDVLNEKDQ